MAAIKRKAVDLAAEGAKKPKPNASITSFFGTPQRNSSTFATNPGSGGGATESPQVKFDKDEWIKGLSEEQRELLKLEIETLHESWLAVLKDEVVSKEFLSLKRFLKQEGESGKKVFPPMQDVYSW